VEGGEILLRVWDEGIGIPPEHLSRVGQPFYQVEGGTTRRFGGMGIGLAAVRAILEAHGGAFHLRPRTPPAAPKSSCDSPCTGIRSLLQVLLSRKALPFPAHYGVVEGNCSSASTLPSHPLPGAPDGGVLHEVNWGSGGDPAA
jgi:hypothetical protein